MLLDEQFPQELPQMDVLFAGGHLRTGLWLHAGGTWWGKKGKGLLEIAKQQLPLNFVPLKCTF